MRPIAQIYMQIALALIIAFALLSMLYMPMRHVLTFMVETSMERGYDNLSIFVRDDNETIYLPQWESGNRWVYNFEMHGYSNDISNMVVTGQIKLTVEGTDTINVGGSSIETYKVYYERIFSGSGATRGSVTMTGTTTGYEYYAKDTLELVKAEYHTLTSGQGSEGGFSVSFTINDDTTMEETTIGNIYAFPIVPLESWSSYSVEYRESHTVTDYTPDGGFYPDDSDVTSTVTVTHDMSSITSSETMDFQCTVGTFKCLEITITDQWSRSDGLSNTGTIKRYFSRDVGNFVYMTVANIYDFGFIITNGWLDLGDYEYTYRPPPEYGFNAYPDVSERSVRPGESAEFTITIWNYGGFDDTITAEVLDGGSGWLTLSQASITLPMGGSGTITATVSVPENAQPNTYVDNIKFVSQGDSTKTMVVTIKTTVLENLPPKIVSMKPKSNYTEAMVNETVTFMLSVQDPDADPVTIWWYVDDEYYDNGNSISLSFNCSGNHTIRAVISDGKNYLNVSWHLRILPPGSNRSPKIVYFSPINSEVKCMERTYVDFIVHVIDPEADFMEIEWFVDDENIAYYSATGEFNYTQKIYLSSSYSGKWHTVRCSIRDDSNNVISIEWQLYVYSYDEIKMRLYNITPPEFTIVYPRGIDVEFGFDTNYSYPYYVIWFLDDQYMAMWENKNHITVNTSTLGDGDHKILLIVTSKYGDDYFEYRWNITVAEDFYPSPEYRPDNSEIIVLNQGETQEFRIINPVAQDSFTWYLDGKEIIEVKGYSYKYHADDAPGIHVISVRVRNKWGNYAFVNWTIKITNFVNKPPTIDYFYPPRSVILYKNQSIEFKIKVSDNDNITDDVITILWYVDDMEIFSGERFVFNAKNFAVGEHTVVVEVSDGKFQVKKEWNVIVEEHSEKEVLATVPKSQRTLCYAAGIIIFGLLIGIVYFAYVPESKKKRRKKVELHCPVCMAYVSSDWNICPLCGNILTLRCRGCGSPILSDWRRCPMCHKALTPNERGLKGKRVGTYRKITKTYSPPMRQRPKSTTQKPVKSAQGYKYNNRRKPRDFFDDGGIDW